MDILLIAFDDGLKIALNSIDSSKAKIKCVVTAFTSHATALLGKAGLLDVAVSYEKLETAISNTNIDYIVYSEYRGGDVESDLLDLRVPANKLINITSIFGCTCMSMLFQYYKENVTDYKMAIVGSSYSFFAIDLNELNCKAINFSLHSQDLYYSWKMMEKAYEIPDMALEKIIIQIAPWSFDYDESLVKNAWDYVWQYAPVCEDTHNLPISYDILKHLIRSEVRCMVQSRQFDLNNLVKDKDFEKKFSESVRALIGLRKRAETWLHKRYPSTCYENEQILVQMLRKSHIKGIKPYLLITPCSERFRQYFPARVLSRFNKILSRICHDELDFHVDVINLYDDMSFSDDDFGDADHLNYVGSIKVTRKINARILGRAVSESLLHFKNRIALPSFINGDVPCLHDFLYNLETDSKLAGNKIREFLPMKWNKKVVIIYGAGRDADKTVSKLNQMGIYDYVICDTNKYGMWKGKRLILSPYDIFKLIDSPIIISSRKYALSVYESIKKLGIEDKRVFYI